MNTTATKHNAPRAPRYSNYGPPTEEEYFRSLGGGGTPSGGSGSSGRSLGINLTDMLDSLTGMVSSIWGKGDKHRADAYARINEEQKKTNAVLWVVIGLMVALGVFLVVRKSN